MRPLTRVYLDALHSDGYECLLVTSDQHYEPVGALGYERVLDPRPKDLRTLRPLLHTVAEACAFRPDDIVVELVWDPQWLALTQLAPTVHLVHDDQPHDATEARPAWQRVLFRHFCVRAARVVCFSEHVAARLADRFGRRVDVVPLG